MSLLCLKAFATEVPAVDVSVRLRSLKGAISVSGVGLKVFSPQTSRQSPVLEMKAFDRLSFRFKSEADVDTWTVASPIDDRVLAVISGSKVAVFGSDVRVDLRPAPDHIDLVAKLSARAPSLHLVGFLSIESYLERVVASEVPGNWPIEALKAQAIAARSFTLAKIRERANAKPDWMLESNVTDQVFDYERDHSRATNAVKATKGEVLTNGAGEVVSANYHADCGGRTDEARAIWGGGVKTGTAVDAACISNRSPWRFVRSLSELTSSLSAGGLIPAGFRLAALSVSDRSSGGRALSLRLKSTEGRTRLIPGEKLRATLGYGDLKSTMFEIKAFGSGDASRVEFTGRGFGHGTGLCQWGARELAQNGKSYREILQHYYPLLKLSI